MDSQFFQKIASIDFDSLLFYLVQAPETISQGSFLFYVVQVIDEQSNLAYTHQLNRQELQYLNISRMPWFGKDSASCMGYSVNSVHYLVFLPRIRNE